MILVATICYAPGMFYLANSNKGRGTCPIEGVAPESHAQMKQPPTAEPSCDTLTVNMKRIREEAKKRSAPAIAEPALMTGKTILQCT